MEINRNFQTAKQTIPKRTLPHLRHRNFQKTIPNRILPLRSLAFILPCRIILPLRSFSGPALQFNSNFLVVKTCVFCLPQRVASHAYCVSSTNCRLLHCLGCPGGAGRGRERGVGACMNTVLCAARRDTQPAGKMLHVSLSETH